MKSIALAEYAEAERRFDSKESQRLREQSLRFSVRDGAFWSVMTSFGENFISAFAIALKATSFELGLLASLPVLIGSLIQLPAAGFIELWGERKKIIGYAVFIQALSWIPILLIPFFFAGHAITVLLVFFTFYFVLGQLANPAWQSLMGDLVPAEMRGKFFANRNKVIRVASFGSTIAAGMILGAFPESESSIFLGFGIIFGIAMLARFASWHYIGRMHEPAPVLRREHSHDFIDFMENLTKTNFGKFVLFSALFTFSMQVAAPYFSLFMLRELGFNYVSFTFVIASGIIGAIIAYNFWGRMADRFGNRKLLTITTILVCLTPALWLVNQSLAFLIAIEFIAGFYYAGFSQCLGNFVFDSTLPEIRHKQVAFYNAINGTALFAGAMAGALLLYAFPKSAFWLSGIILVFAVSSILRLSVAFLVLPAVKEERKVEEISEAELIARIASINTIKGIFGESLADIRNGLVLGARDIQALERLALRASRSSGRASGKSAEAKRRGTAKTE